MGEYYCGLISKGHGEGFAELASLAEGEGVSLRSLLARYELELRPLSEAAITELFVARCRLNPGLYVRLPVSEVAHRILSRSVCIEKFVHVYAVAPTVPSLVTALVDTAPESLFAAIRDPGNSFAFFIDFYRQSVSFCERVRLIDQFEPLPFAGKVAPTHPKLRLWLIRDANDTYLFGLEIARVADGAKYYSKYSLSTREYLGPTSTDTELAFLMANQGQVSSDSLVLDPFVGTGSILVAATHFGAMCFGSDIDMRVLKGTSVGRSRKRRPANVFTNFENYGLTRPEMVRGDNSHPAWRRAHMFDAVICDPPYGIRARSRTAGTRKARQTYIPDTHLYDTEDVYRDLLGLAVDVLRTGGRLVYLILTDPTDYVLPTHPLLRLTSSTETAVVGNSIRRLITMERVAEA